jgi:hypothetical protein
MSFDSNTKSIVAYMLAHTTTLVACIFSRRLLVAVVPVGSVDGTTAIHGRQPEQTYTLTYNPTAEQTSGAQKTSQQSIRHPILPVTPAADQPTYKPKYKSPRVVRQTSKWPKRRNKQKLLLAFPIECFYPAQLWIGNVEDVQESCD